MPWTAFFIVSGLILVVGVPLTLAWWRYADRWADAEKKRFKTKQSNDEVVVISEKKD